jgi:CelD/BcsL family acetyltransferase involved in cellulose biosynthesis
MDTQLRTGLSVEVLSPGALRPAERDAWRAIVAASPELRSPFFRLEFALAADGVVPGASVAVIYTDGRLVGFLPFQRRQGMVQPLGAPLCDYNGLIAWPEAELDYPAVLRLIGARAYSFTGLISQPPASANCQAATVMRADVDEGLDAMLADHPSARKFFKEKARAWRVAERDLGPLTFQLDDADPDLPDFIVSRKRDQYRRTARHDIFGCRWTEELLRRLWDARTPDFGAQISTLRADGRLIAAELGLRAGGVRHIWFPTYDPDFARWGPGILLMIELTKAAAADPTLCELDYGCDGEGYKRHFAKPAGTVHHGRLAERRLPALAGGGAFAAAPVFQQVAKARARVQRRLDIITACETKPAAWIGGAMDAIITAGRRGPALAAANG